MVRCLCIVGVRGVGMRAEHQLHSARSCEVALRAVEVTGGPLRGGASRAVTKGVCNLALIFSRLPILGAGS